MSTLNIAPSVDKLFSLVGNGSKLSRIAESALVEAHRHCKLDEQIVLLLSSNKTFASGLRIVQTLLRENSLTGDQRMVGFIRDFVTSTKTDMDSAQALYIDAVEVLGELRPLEQETLNTLAAKLLLTIQSKRSPRHAEQRAVVRALRSLYKNITDEVIQELPL